MATEKRLIDANALKIYRTHDAGANHPLDVAYRKDIDNTPTVDAVEVVRCGKCKWYDLESEFCEFWYSVRHPEHYCGEGERKDNER